MASRCPECLCVPHECSKHFACIICNKESCCMGDHVKRSRLLEFLHHARRLYAAALGIEILCIAAAEIGENSGLCIFGFSPAGVKIAYAMGYALAGFTTFASILGRYSGDMACGCCSMLEQGARKEFAASISKTMKDFGAGVVKLHHLYRQPNLKQVLKCQALSPDYGRKRVHTDGRDD